MYAQALGAILGLILCLYEYVYGDLVVIGNLTLSNSNILSSIVIFVLQFLNCFHSIHHLLNFAIYS